MTSVREMLATLLVGLGGVCALQAHAQTDVTFAGVAFSGDAASIPQRFQYANWYEQELRAEGESGYGRVLAAMQQAPAQSVTVSTHPIEELKGRDQAVVTALVLTSETVSTERFGEVRKLLILERGQAMFFDFKSMSMLRSYPFSLAYIDNLRRDPTEEDIRERVKMVFEGAGGKPGIYGRYANLLAKATLPSQTPRFLQVTHVAFAPDMVARLPQYLKASDSEYQTWAADVIGEALSSRLDVPLVPFSQGYAVGRVMTMQVSDGDVYNLKLPTPDYEISVDFTGMKKVKLAQTGAGATWAYGVLGNVQIAEPLTNTLYLGTALKNAEVKVVPASQTEVDDFPAYDDTLRGMFVKLADAVGGGDAKWVKAAAAAPDIEAQLRKTKDLVNQCK